MNKNQNLHKELPSFYDLKRIIIRLVFVGLTGVGFFYFVRYVSSDTGFEITYKHLAGIISAFIMLVESIIALDHVLEKFIPINLANIHRRFTLQLIISLHIGVLIFVCFYLFMSGGTKTNFNRELIMAVPTALFLLMFSFSGSIMGRLAKKFVLASKEIETLKLEKMNMNYRALQDQLNPHFLFNNLSVLKSMVFLKNDKAALQFIQNFSSVYRYVLKGSDLMTTKLLEEVEFIKQYISLHQERLRGGLMVVFDLNEEELNLELPPMTLQLLVENAIKHNIAEKDRVLTIHITAKNKNLCVENNVQLKDASYSTKMGLKNLLNRYQLLTDRNVKVEDINGNFKVTVPLLCEQ